MVTSRKRGELELSIMNVLWDAETPLSAREIQVIFESSPSSTHTPAITTIITVLDRLRAKGMVQRQAEAGRSYVFRSANSRIDDVSEAMHRALNSVDDSAAALVHFAGGLSQKDREFLRRAISR